MQRPRPIHAVRGALLSRRKRHESIGIILMYHRVAPTGVDPWQLLVTPEHFAEHLDVVRRLTKPVALRRMVADQRNGRLEDRTLAITFDDGYLDNLTMAKPLLARADIPATVYVATGPTGTAREFWWDELDRALLLPPVLPPTLELTLDGQSHTWTLKKAVNGAWDEKCGCKATPARMRFHLAVWQQLRVLPPDSRQQALDRLFEWSGSPNVPRQSHRVMTADELISIESDGLIELGAHTVTHPLLPSLSPEVQRSEMATSRASLERLLGHEVTAFSYPFGGADATTVALAQSIGFDSATTIQEETVWRENDALRLPRFAVRDWDGSEFERRLTRWFTQHVAPIPS